MSPKATIPRQIDYYFTLLSPWSYIGHDIFQRVVTDYNCKVNYKPVLATDLFAETGGLPLPKRHPARQRYRLIELQRWRDKRGLTFHVQPAHGRFDVKLADQLVIAISESGHDPDPFLRRAFPAVWEQQLDLANPDVLTTLANDAGLPGRMLMEQARSSEVAAKYSKNREDAVASDVFGFPAYVLDGEVFWGQDRIELLADALKSQRKPYRGEM